MSEYHNIKDDQCLALDKEAVSRLAAVARRLYSDVTLRAEEYAHLAKEIDLMLGRGLTLPEYRDALRTDSATEFSLRPDESNCWVNVDNISVYIKRNDEGVSVDLFQRGGEDDNSHAATWDTFNNNGPQCDSCGHWMHFGDESWHCSSCGRVMWDAEGEFEFLIPESAAAAIKAERDREAAEHLVESARDSEALAAYAAETDHG